MAPELEPPAPGEDEALSAAGPLADWDLAANVAWRVASADTPSVTRAEVAALRADLDRAVTRADALARAATGIGDDLPPASVHVLGRRAWIQSNLASIAELVDPLADRLTLSSGMTRAVARKALGVQLGAVFGYLSTKVLGQYEVFRPGGQVPGRLVLVGPNLLELERGMLREVDITADEFRLGICLHEIAHRLQFEGVPWLRGHLRGILDTYLAETRLDPDRLRETAGRLGELLRDPSQLADPQRLLELVLTPAQAETVKSAQALMTLLEGHGNVVMDWGAAEEEGVLEPSKVREVLGKRRSRAVDRAMRRALGLSMKAQQYQIGEQWILDVVERHGRAAFERVWEGPELVPTPDELRDPDAWARRVAA